MIVGKTGADLHFLTGGFYSMLDRRSSVSTFFFFYFAFVGLFSPYLSLWLNFRGFTPTEIGILMSPMQWTRIIGPGFWGTLADYGKRFVSIKGIMVTAALLALLCSLLLFKNFDFFLLLLILISLTFFLSGLTPLSEVIALRVSKKIACNYGDLRVWGSVGFLVSVLAYGILIDTFGTENIPIFLFISLSFVLLSSILINGETDGTEKVETIVIRELFNSKVRLFLIASLFMIMSHAVLYTFFSLWLKSVGYSKIEIGSIWAIGVLSEIVFFLNQDRILSRFKNLMFVWFLCFVVAVVRFLVFFCSDGLLVLLVFGQLLHAITFGLHHVTSIMLIANLFPDSAKAIGQSSYTIASYGVGGSLGGVFSGLIWEEFLPDSIFVFASVVAFLGVLVAWRLFRRYKGEWD